MSIKLRVICDDKDKMASDIVFMEEGIYFLIDSEHWDFEVFLLINPMML